MGELLLIAVLLVMMVATGAMALFLEDLMASILLFSAFSFFAVLMYLSLGAPDVAFTEAVIGVVATTFFIAALKRLQRGCSR